MDIQAATLTFKVQSLYVAFAPEFDVSAYGTCQDEALNNLVDELHANSSVLEAVAEERSAR